MTSEQVRLAGVLQLAIESVLPAIAAEQQVLDVVGVEVDAIVEVDALLLPQPFGNLLITSLRKTPWGGALHVGISHDDKAAVIRFSDSGPTLLPDELASVFELYGRSSSSVGEEIGIELALVRGLIEMNGGAL